MKRLAAIACAWIACAAPSLAQQIPDIAFDEFYLDNGLRVVVHEDRKAPIVAVTVWYHVGSKNEEPGKTGFAHLFEHLMFNGTENYDGEYFAPFQEVGATGMNGTTDFDRTNYFQTVPSTAVDLALWMESDRMGHLLGAVDQARLDAQRGVVQNEKRQGENEPYGRVFAEILRGLFPAGHPYSWDVIGSMEDLDAASLDDVHRWFETYYGPNNATLVLAGDIDVETAKRKVEHFFGDIPPGPPLTKMDAWIPAGVDAKRIVMQDRVPQARIYKVFRGPHWKSDDATLLQLADYVLTSGKTSRFYERLVYEDQIASSAAAYQLAGEIAGAYVIYATALPGQPLAELERALDEELVRFLDGGPTRTETERVKTEIKSTFIRGIEQVGGFSGKSQILAESAVFGGRPDYYEHSLSVLESATPAAITAAARRWLSGNAITIEVQPFQETLAASGGGADRSGPPVTDVFPAAPFPRLERTTLDNGMELIVASHAAVPVVQLRLQMDAGYAADRLGKPGVASLAMSMLDEGTADMDALEISDALARLGARLSSGSNLDNSYVSLSALKANLDASLDVYADVVLNPSFPAGELERLRRLQLSAIRQEKNTPMDMALRVLPGLLYGDDHAYSLPMTGSGTEASVASIARDDLVEFHETWFKPSNATMIVTGDVTLAEIEPKLEALFAGWQPGEVPDKSLPAVALPTGPRVFLIDRPGAEQSVVIAGQVVGGKRTDGEIALQAMNDILGGNFTSRVNMNLREDKAWSYGARTTIVDTQAQRPFLAYAPVQTDRTAPSMLEMTREIEEIVLGRPPTDAEVATAKKRATLTLPGRWETAGAVAADIAEIVRFDLPDDYWNRYPARVEALDTRAVAAAARDWLAPNQLTWVVVGDLARIEAEVAALDLGPLQVLDSEGNIINRR